MKWISVDDKLPEATFGVNGEDFIIIFNGECVQVSYFDGAGFCHVDDNVYYYIRSVTHWMPLPEPPED